MSTTHTIDFALTKVCLLYVLQPCFRLLPIHAHVYTLVVCMSQHIPVSMRIATVAYGTGAHTSMTGGLITGHAGGLAGSVHRAGAAPQDRVRHAREKIRQGQEAHQRVPNQVRIMVSQQVRALNESISGARVRSSGDSAVFNL